MPTVTFGGGASGLDPIVPPLSGVYTYQNVIDIVRLLAHASGNTTVITDPEVFVIVKDLVANIAKENWKILAPVYLQSATFNVNNTSNPYKVEYSTLNPYMDKLVGAVFYSGTARTPVAILDSNDFERRSKLTNTNAGSVLGNQTGQDIDLYVGSSVSSSPQDCEAELYYFRQTRLNDSTVSTYVDLPDNFIPDLIDRAVFQVERTKE